MQKTVVKKFISYVLAILLTAVTVFSAPITALAADTEPLTQQNGPETAPESTEANLLNTEEEQDLTQLQAGSSKKARIGDMKYDTVQEAIDAAEAEQTVTIVMLADTEENLSVDDTKSIILDLNGNVLCGAQEGKPVIDNSGALEIKDSNSSKAHYFNYVENGLWTWDPEASDGDSLDEIDEETTVVKIPGGCITGGQNEESGSGSGTGGGIYNFNTATLTINGCTIVGNTATDGGGMYLDAGDGSWSIAMITGTTFCGNTASKDGGAVNVFKCTQLLMNNCTVKGNYAGECGGGICKPDGNDSGIKLVLLNTNITGNAAGTNGGGVYFYYYGTCFAAGTPITMADGSKRNIEDITEGDLIKTFDHETGKLSSAPVYYAYKGEIPAVPFTLTFDNGKILSIVGCHDLLEQESRKYVTITESNAETFIGSSFYGEDGRWHKLLSVTEENDPCNYYSLYTAGHQNCFANGFLSVPDDVDYLLNIYELDENLKADEESLASDIAEFGLYSFEDAKEICDISREWFDAAGTKYMNIIMGKGLLSYEEARELFDSLNGAGTNKTGDTASAGANDTAGTDETEGTVVVADTAAAEIKKSAPALLSAALRLFCEQFVIPAYADEPSGSAPQLSDYGTDVLTIGPGTKIIGNTAGDSHDPENVYLCVNFNNKNNLIALTDGSHEGIYVGVTTKNQPSEETPIQFTEGYNVLTGASSKVSKADEAHFFSDKTEYADRFNDGENCDYLELVAGLLVTEETGENGFVSVGYAKSFYVGETVTVTATPDEGYITEKITAHKTGDTDTPVDVAADGTFTMPGYPVTVCASFGEFRCYIDKNNNGKFDKNEKAFASVQNAVTAAGEAEVTGTGPVPTAIRMVADCEENVTIGDKQCILLDLNGYVLSADADGSVILNYGSLTVADSRKMAPHYFDYSATDAWVLNTGAIDGDKLDQIDENTSIVKLLGGCITGGTGHVSGDFLDGGGICSSDGKLTVNGGNIVGNTAGRGGGICGADFTMDGGTVCGNKADIGGGIFGGTQYELTISDGTVTRNTAGQGGGIYHRNALKLAGGTISCNTASFGGGIYNDSTSAVVSGGTIKYNIATEQGGGVYNTVAIPFLHTPGADFEMTGGIITRNEAAIAGGVSFGKTVTLGGTAYITGNTGLGSKTADDLYLFDGNTVAISTAAPVAKGSGNVIQKYMYVGVRTETEPTEDAPVAITGSCSADFHKFFFTDEKSFGIRNQIENIVELYCGAPVPEPDEPSDQSTKASGITGTWTRNADGSWSFGNAADPRFAGTWAYIANAQRTASDWYYFGTDGKAFTGFHTIDGKTYYFRKTKDARECAMATGWLLDENNDWYYLDKSNGPTAGTLQKGWMTDPDDGYRYYLDPVTGKMYTGRAIVDGKEYYFNEIVPAASGWTQNAKGDWVYSRQRIIPLGAVIEQ